jgi:tRNA 2-thiouridine synthesizing protein C
MTASASPTPGPLILLSRAPYDGSLCRSALDLALSFAVFAQEPRLLFCDDAVLALLPGQNPDPLGRKSLRKVIDSLPLYDIDEILVDASSLARHGICEPELPPFARVVDSEQQRELLSEASHVLSL